MDKKTLKATAKLWMQAVEEDQIEDIEPDVVIGAHYAKLALDGTVKLTESGEEKVEAAREALAAILGADE
jgi:hypothetical protein